MLAKSKLNSIGTLTSQILINLDVTHEEFKRILNGKERYEQIKEIFRNTESNDRKDDLSENNKNNR